MEYTAASFFSGIGGLDLAAERAGFRVSYQCENEPYPRAVLRKNFPGAILLGDINGVTGKDFDERIDLIFGGFPCTDISIGTGRNGKGLAGERSGLWFQLARIIGEIRPRCVMLENVPAITFRGGTTVTANLAGLGYDCIWIHLRAASVGSPQYRNRWLLLGYANGIRRQIADAAGLYPSSIGACGTKQQIPERGAIKRTREGSRTRARQLARGRVGSESRLGGCADGVSARLDICTHEFPAGSWQSQKAWEPPRLAPDNAERAQRVKALGNAVVPQQAYPIFAALYEFLIELDGASAN